MNALTLDVQLDVSQLMQLKKRQSILTFRVENVFNEQINVPEFNRGGNPNSLPDGPGTTFFVGLKIDF
jgi:outer membrane receptor protein involved in Fe transport